MQAAFTIRNEQGTLILSASGEWDRASLSGASSPAGALMEAAASALKDASAVSFRADDLETWDSLLLATLHAVAREARKNGLSHKVRYIGNVKSHVSGW